MLPQMFSSIEHDSFSLSQAIPPHELEKFSHNVFAMGTGDFGGHPHILVFFELYSDVVSGHCIEDPVLSEVSSLAS